MKGPYIYDPEKREFRRRGRTLQWEEESGAGAGAGEGSAEDVTADATAVGGVEKPDGYLDPTPVRRRRKSRSGPREASRTAKHGNATAWKGVMWILILLMGLIWVYMLYVQTRDAEQSPENEKFFHFERDDVVPP